MVAKVDRFEDRISTAVADHLFECALAGNTDRLKTILGREIDTRHLDILCSITPSGLPEFALALRKNITVTVNANRIEHAAEHAASTAAVEQLIDELLKNDAPLPFMKHFFGLSKTTFMDYRRRYGLTKQPGEHRPAAKLDIDRCEQLLQYLHALLQLKGGSSVDDLTAEDWLAISRQTGISLRLLWSFYNDSRVEGAL